MKKRRSQKMSKAKYAGRWLAAWAIGLAIMAYTVVVGLPCYGLMRLLQALGDGCLVASGWARKAMMQLARPANWAFAKALKIHPRGKQIKRSL